MATAIPPPTRNTMDFFGAQDAAKKRTFWLVMYFVLCVVLIVVAIYLAVWAVLLWGSTETDLAAPDLFMPRLFMWVAGGTLLIIFACAGFKFLQLAGGGAVVAEMLGGRLVPPNTRDPDERKLLNIVEEMSIASGIHVPPVYILEDERGINAFAAGHTPNTAVVAVTLGTLRLLDRDELQGVIAHEFSHILNGDMKMNLRLIAILFGILGIYTVGYWILRSSTGGYRRHYSQKKGGNPLPVLGLLLMVIGGVGLLFGKLIKAAISRQREFLADASAVQFTRNPAGIAGALKKIGGYSPGARIDNSSAEEAAHLFFADGIGATFLNAMATHPPLDERIRRVDPHFDGKFARLEAPEDLHAVGARAAVRNIATKAISGRGPEAGLAVAALAGLAQHRMAGRTPPSPGQPSASGLNRGPASLDPDTVLRQVGQLDPAQIEYAEQLMFEIPGPLLDYAHDPLGASALVYGLLLNDDPQVLERQLAHLAQHAHPAVNSEVKSVRQHLPGLPIDLRLKLLDLSLPALQQLAVGQYQELKDNVQKLIDADNHLSLFEFMLTKLMRKQLDQHFSREKTPPAQYYSLNQLGRECEVLLTFVARAGTYGENVQAEDTDPEKARLCAAAFLAGEKLLNLRNTPLKPVPLNLLQFQVLDRALRQFLVVAPGLKKRVLAACAAAIAIDKAVMPEEAEIFRAIAAAIDCPIPPLFSTPAA